MKKTRNFLLSIMGYFLLVPGCIGGRVFYANYSVTILKPLKKVK